MDYVLYPSKKKKIVSFENVTYSKAMLLLPRKIGNYDHSREICMISASIKVT